MQKYKHNIGVSENLGKTLEQTTLNNLPSPAQPGTFVPVKIIVYITPKKTVLDPQGTAVKHAMNALGCQASDVRVGKTVEFHLDGDPNAPDFKSSIEKICNDLLANPVIEGFNYEVLQSWKYL